MQATANKPTKQRRRVLWIAAIVVVGLLIAGAFFLFQMRNSQADAAAVQTGDTVSAFTGDLSASATASGQVEAVQSANISVAQPGTVETVLVAAGTPVEEGDPLVQLNQRDLALQVERMQQNVVLKEAGLQALLTGASPSDIATAEAAVQSAQATLDDLLAGPSSEQIAEYEAIIRQQQAGVWSASASYNSTADSIKASSLASAEAELVSAQIAYDQAKERNEDFAFSFTHEALLDAEEDLRIAQARVDELNAGPKQGSLNSASADISAAQANLNKSQADYEALLTGSSSAQISAAEASLARALADLTDLKKGASAQDVAIAEAELEQARLNLQAAEEALAESIVVAPFDGLVTDVFVSVGERATGNVVELVSSDLEVVLQVDELDIGSLSPGQPAIITFEAWPDVELDGQIKSIAPSADGSADSVVNYDVEIVFDSADVPILVGMTADAQLITDEKEDALLVPNAAVTADRRAGTYSVNLVVGEEDGEPMTESREVVVGLKDKDFTEILSGLAEGDTVLIGELAAPTIDFGGGPGFDGD
jgi:RND family efflux transporter MFP subunit